MPRPSHLASLVEQWCALNEPFTRNDSFGAGDGECTLVVEGRRPIVFSAPHAVHHSRRGVHKSNDANTGGLALALARHLDASAVALRRGGESFGDPNADIEHPFKDAAAHLVGAGTLLVDLHGMADREHDVIVGLGAAPTDSSRSIAERFVKAARHVGVAATIADDRTGFHARGTATMTTWALRRGADALQLEIARNLRSVRAPVERRAALLHALVSVFDEPVERSATGTVSTGY